MNLAELRDLVLDLRAWTSSGTAFDKRLNRAINLAYRKMSKDVPEALVPTTETHFVYKDQTTADTKVYLYRTEDPWTLEFKDADGDILGLDADITWRPLEDGQWDGLMHLELTEDDGTVRRLRCREFFTDKADPAAQSGSNTRRVTVDRPHGLTNNTKKSFRLYQPNIYLKSDYVRVVDASAWDSEYQNDQLQRLDVGLVDRLHLRDFRGENKGTPNSIYQGAIEQLRGPTRRPTVMDTANSWSSIDYPKGVFKFRYTYVWGVASERNGYIKRTEGGLPDPIIESPPSPESSQFTMGSSRPKIQFEDIDKLMNFGLSYPYRKGKTGLKIRVYAARVKTLDDATMGRWPADDTYYPIADIDPPTADVDFKPPYYEWNGDGTADGLDSVVPDIHRPLAENHLYRAWGMYPHQDKDFRVDFRVLRPPHALQDDGTHPMVEPDSEPALVEIVLYYLSLMDGADQAGAQVHLGNYANELKSVRAQHASPSGNIMPATWDEAGTRDWNLKKFEEI